MTREEAIQVLSMVEAHGTLVIQAKEMAIKALSEKDWKFYYDHGYAQAKRDLSENKGDLINRQAVLDGIEAYIEKAQSTGTKDDFISFEELVVKELPPVNPQKPICPSAGVDCEDCPAYEPKTGHWIYDKNIENWRCSKCGETPKTLGYCGTADFMAEHFKYCNHCGIRMVEPQESEKINCKTTKCENCQNHNYCDYEPQAENEEDENDKDN